MALNINFIGMNVYPPGGMIRPLAQYIKCGCNRDILYDSVSQHASYARFRLFRVMHRLLGHRGTYG